MGSINKGSFKVNKVSARSDNNTKAYNQGVAGFRSASNKFAYRDKMKANIAKIHKPEGGEK